MKKNEDSKKFKFGRNPLSILIVLGALVLLFFIFYPIYSYTTTWNNNNVTPFVTFYEQGTDSDAVAEKMTAKQSTSLPSDMTSLDTEGIDVVRMNGKDFDIFTVNVKCTAYNNHGMSDDSASFTVTALWHDQTAERLGGSSAKLVPFDNDSTKDIKFSSCFAADWVGFCKYQSSNSLSSSTISMDEDEESYSGASFSSKITGLDYFPTKAKTFPVNISKKAPDLFIYLEFKVQNNGTKTKIYILKYTFDEYNPNGAAGGIYSA